MTPSTTHKYEAQNFTLPDTIEGLSPKQLEVHLGLYRGYVAHVNTLYNQLHSLLSCKENFDYAASELRRRLGFEFNGMRLHEYYFQQLENGAHAMPAELINILSKKYNTTDNFLVAIKKTAMSRGIGWTIWYRDPATHTFHIGWVSDHEWGMLAGIEIVFALDMWEHAFMVDYTPAEKENYIDAYLEAVNWEVVAQRLL